MKATFFERIGSYLIDTIIVSFIFSIICLGFGTHTSETEKKMQEIEEQFLNKEITAEKYAEEYSAALYDYQKENILQSGISVALTIAYYVIFQYMNKGQTIGKKVLRIRVVDKNTNKPTTIFKGFIRSMIIYSILSGTLSILFLYICNKNNYFTLYISLLSLELIFSLITIIFMLYKKDGRGLHDIMSNTIVVKESR